MRTLGLFNQNNQYYSADELRSFLIDLLAAADEDGFIITIERKPLKPLAMRNAISIVDVREKR